MCVTLQTGDLGLDIGAQGEPLGYRQDGRSPLYLWMAGMLPEETQEEIRRAFILQQKQLKLIYFY